MIFPCNLVFESAGGRLGCLRDPGRYFIASADFRPHVLLVHTAQTRKAKKILRVVAEIWGITISRRTYYDASPEAPNFAWTSLNLRSGGLGQPYLHFRGPHPYVKPLSITFNTKIVQVVFPAVSRKAAWMHPVHDWRQRRDPD